MGTFVVALTASSAVRFEPGESVALRGLRIREGLADVRWFTRYSEEGYESPVPRELWVDVRGEASSLEVARAEFMEAGRALTVLLALAANAPIEDAEWEIAFEDTPGAMSRDFAQRFIATETGMPRSARVLDRGLVAPVVNAIMGHAQADRLHRAAVHYNEALKAWRPGTELRAVTHLWVAVEALTPVALRRELKSRGVARGDLCVAWHIDVKGLDPEVRRRLVFGGDYGTYSEALAISDAVEHAFEPLADLHPRAIAVRGPLATHVRTAILTLADIPSEARDALVNQPYAEPRESFPLTRILRGRLVGAGDVLGAEGQPYPFMHMTEVIEQLARTEEGGYVIRPRQDIRVELAPGISLTPTTLELWGPKQDSASFGPTTDSAGVRTASGPLAGTEQPRHEEASADTVPIVPQNGTDEPS